MKKFCHKITKQQWRVSVPNINTSIFRKSFTRDESEKSQLGSKESKKSSSGTYDLQEAEKHYKISNSVPNSVFDSDSSDSESDEKFEDARMVLDKSNTNVSSASKDIVFDSNLYVDLQRNEKCDQNLNKNFKHEREVPTISFSFFDSDRDCDQYETVNVNKHQSSIKIELAKPVSTSDTFRLSDNIQDDRCSTPTEETSYSNEVFSTPKSTMTEEYSVPVKVTSHDEDTILVRETKHIELYMTKSLEELTFNMKCGSDPNVCLRTIQEENDDDGLYKVPRPLQRHRISLSLNDCTADILPLSTCSVEESIEHISCSQVLLEKCKAEHSSLPVYSNSEGMDYCYAREKLPAKLRRVTLLRKPKNKAVDTWTNLKLRVNNLSHIGDKEKITNNIEGMYRSSKNKCKRVLKQTGMMFKTKKDQENMDPNRNPTPHMIKNDAFFATIAHNDGVCKINKVDSQCDVSEPSDSCDRVKVVTPSSGENEKKEEYEFSSIKNAFRKSKYFQAEVGIYFLTIYII